MRDVVHAGLVELVLTLQILIDLLQRYNRPSSWWTRRLSMDPLASLVVLNLDGLRRVDEDRQPLLLWPGAKQCGEAAWVGIRVGVTWNEVNDVVGHFGRKRQ